MKETYNKLVRDRIPEIIESKGQTAVTRILDGDSFFEALKRKLSEEVKEYLETGSIEELADILEVVFTLSSHQGYTPDKLEAIRQSKCQERGGFSGRVHLIEVAETHEF
jgi:predicted house-cleaning noncanonical NTP pyrophosphatase (MazG superfamily)